MPEQPPWPDAPGVPPDPDRPDAAGYAVLPHTADLIVSAWAPSFTGCLDQAIRGLASSYVEISEPAPRERAPLSCDGADEAELLVRVLDEAIYLLDVAGSVAVGAVLTRTATGGLSGWLVTVPVTAAEPVGPAPKAVTRHGLRVGRRDGRWRCAVTVDV